jgi:hypothetical protein
MLVSLALGGAVAASMIATATPASAACYNYEAHLMIDTPTVCVGYDYCDADICIDDPRDLIKT